MSARSRRVARTLVLGLAICLTSGLTPAAAHADPATTGSVAGTLADGTTAVADAGVDLLLMPYGVAIKQTRTDVAGAYRFTDVTPRAYALRFRLPGGLVQFHPSVADLGSAAQVTVLADAETTVREAVMPHGTLGGRITTDAGQAAPGARVQLYTLTGGSPLATVLTDVNGAYLIGYPPAGQLRMAVAAAERGATNQWTYRHRSYTQADPFTVTPGQHTTVNERLFPSGVITGRFTRNGTPVPNVVVYAYSQTNTAESVSNWTGADGTFQLRPYPGSYTVKFVVPSGTGLDQWAGGAESEGASRPVQVTADRTVVIDERQLPVGQVRGRLTDAAGRPSAGSAVVVYDPLRGRQFQATTAADGTWFLTAWPGTYTVRFETGTQVQWARGKRSAAAADPVVVAADATTVVNDVLLP